MQSLIKTMAVIGSSAPLRYTPWGADKTHAHTHGTRAQTAREQSPNLDCISEAASCFERNDMAIFKVPVALLRQPPQVCYVLCVPLSAFRRHLARTEFVGAT